MPRKAGAAIVSTAVPVAVSSPAAVITKTVEKRVPFV
jgi:hypothetical protein